MKRFMMWVALLAMMTLLLGGLSGCGGSGESEAPAEENAVSGNWYIVEGSDITTLKLDAEGGGSLSGESVTYELDGQTLKIDGASITGEYAVADAGDDGEVLKSGDDIFAYRNKDVAKAVAESGGSDDYAAALLGTWYIPVSDPMETLAFSDDGKVSFNGSTSLSYTLEDNTVKIGDDTSIMEFKIVNDETNGWQLNEAISDTPFAWKDEATATAHIIQNAESEDPGNAASSDSSDNAASAGSTANASTKESDYVGHWEGYAFEYSGNTMQLKDVGMTFSIDLQADGTATAMTNGKSDGSATWTRNSDGSITLKDGTGEIPEHSYIDGDGTLHLALEAEEGTMWILCSK